MSSTQNQDTMSEKNRNSHNPADIDFMDWGYCRPLRTKFVIQHLNLHIQAGQHVLLLGESGIGKSTIFAGIAGLLGNDESFIKEEGATTSLREDQEGGLTEGQIYIDHCPASQSRHRCALMMQDPEAQMVLQRVGDNVAFGLENLGVPRNEIWGRVQRTLNSVGLEDLDLHHATSHLSGGQMQRIALAGALCMEPGVLLLDEPTANLDPQGAQEVIQVVHHVLRDRPTTVMIVEHRAEQWLDILDRVVILGRSETGAAQIIADGTPDDVFSDPSIDFDSLGVWVPSKYPVSHTQHQRIAKQLDLKKQVDSLHYQDDIVDVMNSIGDDDSSAQKLILPKVKFAKQKSIQKGTVLLQTNDLAIGHGKTIIAQHINCQFKSGEITILQGKNGAGKSTLSMTLAGLLHQQGGQIVASPELCKGITETDPQKWTSKQLSSRIAFVFQNPEHQFVKNTVLEEVMVGLFNTSEDDSKAMYNAHALLQRFGLDQYADANPYTLSGGEKRRLTVAAALASAPEVLILDEPTFGQDRSTWLEIVMLIRSVADSGVAVIAVTHDQDLIEVLADNIITVGTTDTATIQVTTEKERQEPPKQASVSRVLAGINPAFRFLGAFLISIPLLFSLDPVSAGVSLILVLIAFGLIGIHLPKVVKSVWPVLLMAPWTFLAVVLYGKHGGHTYLHWGMIHITTRSIWLAFATFLRVLAISIPSILLILGIDSTDLADAISQVFHLPDRFVYGGLAGTRLFTVLHDDWNDIQQARRSRGLGDQNKVARFLSCGFALLVMSIRRSTGLSTAMEARAFGADPSQQRSHARISRVRARDWVFAVICLLIPVIALVVSILLGTFSLGGGR